MLALGTPAAAQDIPASPRYGSANIAAELFAEGDLRAGETLWLALRFTPSSEEWHGYWSNPGDAGQGMQLVIPVPEGWTVGEPVYPVPERLLISGLMNHIYKGSYTVLVPVEVGASAGTFDMDALTVYAEYLACTDRICVPQDAILTAQPGGDFARWRAEIAPLIDARARFEIAGDTMRIAVPLPVSVVLPQPHVFVANPQLADYAVPQTFRRSGDLLIAEIPLDQYGTGQADALAGILAFGDGPGVRFVAGPGAVPAGGEIIAGPVGAVTPPLWTLILGALAGGLLLNIMPCVFPILSLKALSLARAGGSESQARSEGLAYTAGVVLACVALGAIMLALRAAGEQVGWAFQLQEPGVVVALLVLAVLITANFAGVFELPSFSVTSGGKPAGAFATGLLAAFVATPCTGPFMAAALGAALLLPVGQALLLFALLGLGLALPFLLLGFIPALRRMLPRPGAWMEKFRRIMAIPMGLTALALIWLTVQIGGRGFALFALVMVFGIVLALFVVGRLQRAGKLAWPAFGLIAAPFLIFGAFALPSSYSAGGDASPAQSLLAPQEFSRDALAAARASGKPVFVWFTADWCVTCKVNESVAIEREVTAQAFTDAGVIAMVADWTLRDEEITGFLTQQGVAGVPLYLWYEPGAEGEQLPQVLTADMLIERASAPR
ncbi:protein-disulfide reductase DsbD family protein [Qipengyuania sp. ASV99]|uniref:protein-disulfide reductase DsbD family protein n=1 Tax=Qipengyuania sp. ASV99 TaxID=3399681 RepID=UPI003A4C6521